MDEDSAEKVLYVCLPSHPDSEGLVLTVGGGPWQSEVSWTISGPCAAATDDFACKDADTGFTAPVVYQDGAPFEEATGCSDRTPSPTPLEEDDVPVGYAYTRTLNPTPPHTTLGAFAQQEVDFTCPSGTVKYLIGLHDSYGDG